MNTDVEIIMAAYRSLTPTAPRWMGRFGALFGVTQHQLDKVRDAMLAAAAR